MMPDFPSELLFQILMGLLIVIFHELLGLKIRRSLIEKRMGWVAESERRMLSTFQMMSLGVLAIMLSAMIPGFIDARLEQGLASLCFGVSLAFSAMILKSSGDTAILVWHSTISWNFTDRAAESLKPFLVGAAISVVPVFAYGVIFS